MTPRPHALLLALLLTPLAAQAKSSPPPDRWVGTWATAPMAFPAKPDEVNAPDTTYREIVHVSLGGPVTRIVLTNEFGTEPLKIGEVHVALSSGEGSISLLSSNALTFSGHTSITIPAGALVVSDPFALAVPAFADLAVTLFLPAQTIHTVSGHESSFQTNYMAPGNSVNLVKLPNAKEFTSWHFLKGVDVQVSAADAAVVCFGDSITDGAHSTLDANARWPDVLARRLSKDKSTKNLGVLNEGIGGNHVLRDGTGPSALARFDRDVLSQAAVRYVILLESINDIGASENTQHPTHEATAETLIAGLRQLAERAHTHGIQIFGATLTPYLGAGYSSPAGEAIRQAVNQWIRTSNQLDGVIDFDKATQDKSNPTVFASFADSGDHLHPGDAGYKAMADAINLKLFRRNKKEKYDITREP